MTHREIVKAGWAEGDPVAEHDQSVAAAIELLRATEGFYLVAFDGSPADGGVRSLTSVHGTKHQVARLFRAVHELIVADVRVLIRDEIHKLDGAGET
jgi:hypothetical protein